MDATNTKPKFPVLAVDMDGRPITGLMNRQQLECFGDAFADRREGEDYQLLRGDAAFTKFRERVCA